MTQTEYTGVDGGVKLGANMIADIDNFNLSIDSDSLPTTAYTDVADPNHGWKTSKQGLKGWSGDASGRFNMTDTTGQLAIRAAQLGGTKLTLSFIIDQVSGEGYTGDAWVKTHAPKSKVDGTADIDFSFDGTGPLTPIVLG